MTTYILTNIYLLPAIWKMAATEVTGQICDGPVAKKFPEGMLYTTIYQTPGFYHKMNNFSSVCLTIIGKQVLQVLN